jgi:2-polyprenyl-3-methyl-5-hydroxy-6-metoxy-1,4-benzoquinol methylase
VSYRESFIEDGRVKSYEDEYTSCTYNHYEWQIEKAVLDRLLRLYLRQKATRHLDFACGTGRITQFVMPFAEETVGVDISSPMIEIARAKCPKAKFVVTDVTSNSESLKQLGHFDLITVFRFLAPAEEELRIKIIKILASCLSVKGIIIINNNANLTSLLYPALIIRSLFGRPFKGSTNYKQALPHRHMLSLLNNAGLDVIESVGTCFLPGIIARRLPRQLWFSIENTLNRLNPAPSLAVNQIVVAIKAPGQG